ncbi:MAG: mechanosensitive ion channel [Flavobacteriaceae bacterium]|nr:mechanosensitive ion channel [Flavobacteriaceae bacterium]
MLVLGDNFKLTLGALIALILALVLSHFLLKFIRYAITRRMEHTDKLKFATIFKIIHYLVYVFVIYAVLSTAGADLTVLLTASAALFVGLGFALQDLFKDIISGIFIIIDKSLLAGDVIEFENKIARVFEIKLRTTRAITRDEKVIIIPNHLFMTQTLHNYTQNYKTTRENVKVGVAYGSDTELVKKLLLECASKHKQVLKNPQPLVLFEDFSDSALLFGLYFYVADSFILPRIASELRFEIDNSFRENNVKIPFPQRDVHLFTNNSKQDL